MAGRFTSAPPISFGAATLPDQIVIAPMCQYSAVDGCMTKWHLVNFNAATWLFSAQTGGETRSMVPLFTFSAAVAY